MSNRFSAKPKLLALVGTECIPAQSLAGGSKVGGGSVAAGADIHIPLSQLLERLLTPKITSSLNAGVCEPDADTDMIRLDNLNQAAEIANPTGTPYDGWGMVAMFRDDGTPRTLTFGDKWQEVTGTLPTTTVSGKWTILTAVYYEEDDVMQVLSVETQQ